MKRFLRILFLVALAVPSHAFAVERWSLQFFGGAPFNFNLPPGASPTRRTGGSPVEL